MLNFLNEFYIFYRETAPYMLFGLIFVGLLHIFVSKDLITRHIGSNSILSAIKASILGVPLPLCSCGVIPTAVYFSKNGASKGAVISFLISTPQTGIDSIIATYGLMGPIFALFRPFAAFLSGVAGGIIANFMDDKTAIELQEDDSHSECSGESCGSSSCCSTPAPNRVRSFYDFAFKEFLDDISVQLIFGIILAAMISFFIPDDFFSRYNIGTGITGMMLMIIVGIPMYICATASIPVALALLAKGISPGAAFVFLAVGPMTNIASISVLFRFLKMKMTVIYLASGTFFAVISGLILDMIFENFQLPIPGAAMKTSEHSSYFDVILNISAILFTVFVVLSIYRNLKNWSGRKFHAKKH